MANGQAQGILRWLRMMVAAEDSRQRPDQELVTRFVHDGDEAAFTLLVQRHGPMVFGVCERLLDHGQDAEDAFQVTFLVFARKAGAIRKKVSVSCWLYGVASRVAANVRRKNARLRSHEKTSVHVPDVAAPEATWRDVRTVLDDELGKLPECLRLPLVLCYLDGKTRDEAAQELGWSESTLRGRLERGRDLLQARLTQRGVTLSAALLAPVLTQNAASALPGLLVGSTVNAATTIAAGKPLAGVVSAKVIGLVLMEVNAMFVGKLIHFVLVASLAALVLGGVAAGTGALLQEPAKEPSVVQKKPEAGADKADVGERDDFVRGKASDYVDLPAEKANDDANAFVLVNATGKGLPKETKVVVIIRKETKFERLVGDKREKIFEDEYPPMDMIAIERAHVKQVKKDGTTWWVEPTTVLVLKEWLTVTTALEAKTRKPAAGDDELRKLLIEKYNAGSSEVRSLDSQVRTGRIVYQDGENLERVIRSIERYVETSLDLANDPAERLAIRKRCLEALKIVDREATFQHRAGRLSNNLMARSTQARLDAEIQLLKEQRRAK